LTGNLLALSALAVVVEEQIMLVLVAQVVLVAEVMVAGYLLPQQAQLQTLVAVEEVVELPPLVLPQTAEMAVLVL
jgi:hypothetical protein